MDGGKTPEKAILFVGALFSKTNVAGPALAMLVDHFGDCLLTSPPLDWNYTHYYDKELGLPIKRRYFFFENIIDPSFLAEAKRITNEIEARFLYDGNRQINLDPGYLTIAKVVLASNKNYSHRVYLGKHVYAEIELYFQGGKYNAFHYTYPDYKDDRFLKFFMETRGLLKTRLDGDPALTAE
jgi:hypothetical protein